MEVVREDLGSRRVKLTITVPQAFLDESRERVSRELSRRHKVPGFRPGKVPLERMIAIVGAEAIDEDALPDAARRAAQAAILEQGLQPGAPVGLEIVQVSPFTIVVTVPLRPEVDLGDYRSLRLPEPVPPPVGDDEVEAMIDRLREDRAYLAPVDRPAAEGDVISVSLLGRLGDSIVFDDDSVTLQLDSASAAEAGLPSGIVEALTGLVAGQEARFDLQYSEFWPQTELQGQTVGFEAAVATVAAKALPEKDDSLAEQLGDVETLDELRESVRQALARRAAMKAFDDHAEAMIRTFVDAATIDYPPELLDVEVTEILQDLRSRVERQGFLWERWIEMQGDRDGAIVDRAEEEARRRIEQRLVFQRFAELEGIGVESKELDKELAAFLETLSPAARRGLPSRKDLRREIAARMLSSRTIERMRSLLAGKDDEHADDEPAENATDSEG